jgi:hypothetical protein
MVFRSRVGVILYVNRSGSTLLSRLLSDASAELFVFPELHFTLGLLAAQRRGRDVDQPSLLRGASRDPRLSALGVDPAMLARLCADHAGDLHGLLDAIATHRLGHPPRAIVVKLEPYVDFVPELDTLFDTPVLIHALRDPRATVSSMLNTPVPGKPGFDMARGSAVWAARHWVRDTQKVERLAATRTVVPVRYETMVADPAAAIEPVLDALGIEATGNGPPYVVAGVDAALHPHVHAPVDTRHAQGWRSRLSARDMRAIEAIGGEAMRRYGYRTEAEVQRLSLGDRVRHWRAMAAHAGGTAWLYARDPAKRRALVDRLRLASAQRG